MTTILLLSCVSAVEIIYAGDCLEVDLSELESLDNVVWAAVGNSSNMIGMNITLDEITKKVNVSFAINYKPDNFTLIFIDNSTKEVIVEVKIPSKSQQGGGGSSYTKPKVIVNATVNDEVNITNVTIIIDEPEKVIPIPESDDKWKIALWVIIIIIAIGGTLYFIFRSKE